jgi:hypothetical protein
MSTTTIQAIFRGSTLGHEERPNNEIEGDWFRFQPKDKGHANVLKSYPAKTHRLPCGLNVNDGN